MITTNLSKKTNGFKDYVRGFLSPEFVAASLLALALVARPLAACDVRTLAALAPPSQPTFTVETREGAHDPALLAQLWDTTAAAFGRPPGTREAADKAMKDGTVFFAPDPQGNGIAGYTLLERQHLHPLLANTPYADMTGAYFAAAMIRPEYQGGGLFRRLSEARMANVFAHRDPILFTRTQNPRVEAGIIAALTRARENGTIRGFSLSYRRLLPGAYGEMLTADRPQVENAQIQSEYNRLNYGSGDAFLLVFSIEYP